MRRVKATVTHSESHMTSAQCVFLAVIELLLSSVLKVGFYIMKWNVTYKCVCVCVELLLHLSLRCRTIFYIGTLLILIACVCVCVCVFLCARACVRARAGVCMCVYAQVCVCAFGCCLVGANGCIPLTMLVDVRQCCRLLVFVCLPLSRHFPCCKTW